MSDQPTSLRELVAAELPRLYAFAYSMSGSRDDARGHLEVLLRDAVNEGEAVMASDKPSDALLGIMARKMEETLGRKSDFSFDGSRQRAPQ